MNITVGDKTIQLSSPSCVVVPDGFHALCVFTMPNGENINCREYTTTMLSSQQVLSLFADKARLILA